MSDLLNSASLVMVPSGYKEDTVYSVVPSDGSGDLAFTRASNGTRINSAGLVEVCPWNLVQYSEDFSNATWYKSNSVITANDTTAPNGTTTADKYAANGTLTSSFFFISQYVSDAIIGQPYTATLYAKAGTLTQMMMYLGAQNGIYWNLSNGQFISYYNGVQNITAYNSESVGNGWYKYTISINASNTSIPLESYSAKSGNITSNYTTADNYYLWGAQLNIGATAKPYFPTTDRLNVPRLTYQNGGGGCPSLLLEKQSTNIVTYSEQFDNAGWTQYQGATITANSVTSPDGTQNADTLTVASGQTYSGIYQFVSASSDVYTVSIFAKYNTKRWLFFFDASASAQGWFDIQNGVLGTIPSGHTGTIENFGNGWYRCTFKKNTAVTPAYFQIGLVDSDGFSSPTSNGSSYIWGAQLEASSYSTSYIQTTSSSATRVADDYSRSLSSIASGTAFINITDNVAVGTPGTHLFGPFSITGASLGLYLSRPNNARLRLWTQASANVFQTTETNLKLAITWDGTNVNVYQNGVKVVTNYSYAITNVNNLFSSTYLESSATIAEIALFNSVLTDAECISLTS